MKLLINASTLSGTGVTQVAISFIKECVKITDNQYFIFLSPLMGEKICITDYPNNFIFYKFESHPLYGISGFKVRRKMRDLEKKISPDCVFSIFGPSYWTPKSIHLMGYAYPHYVYQESPYFKIINLKSLIKNKIYKCFHKFFLKRNGKYYVCETKDVSLRLAKYLSVYSDKIFTVENTYNHFFNLFDKTKKEKIFFPYKNNDFLFLSLCSPYIHKNLTILNKVIPKLYEKNYFNIKFVVTIDDRNYNLLFNDSVKKSIINIGILPIDKCPQIYSECDALFLPTLLECFSANYPEAMYMSKPILTSNLPFAKSVCADAALYFDPLNPDEIVETILRLVNSKKLYSELVSLGEKKCKTFNTSQIRALNYINICRNICGL